MFIYALLPGTLFYVQSSFIQVLLPIIKMFFDFATLLWAIGGLAASVAAAPSASAMGACQAIGATGIEMLSSSTDFLNPEYINAQSHYWSAANADLIPACAVFPTSAEEVSEIVSILLNSTSVDFAIKSGGHNPNVGYSSTDGGVLISMSNMSSTVLSMDQTTADVGPGARWLSVAETLEPYNLTVVSGRLGNYIQFPSGGKAGLTYSGDVGVAGLTLGGGLSFLSAEYGLVCDNVVNYEVVLANASIINANASSNTDLFWALKGGGNQFGKLYPSLPMNDRSPLPRYRHKVHHDNSPFGSS